MTKRIQGLVQLCVLLSLAAPRAWSADYYVDASSGDDSNSGSAPGEAWRTIAHALAAATLDSGMNVIHVAPGVYDAAGGEVFPLRIDSKQSLLASAGPELTIIDGAGIGAPLLATSDATGGAYTSIVGFRLLNAVAGVQVRPLQLGQSPLLRDLRIEGMSYAGLDLWAGGQPGYEGSFLVNVLGCRIEGCARGVAAEAGGSVQGTASRLRMADTSVRACGLEGLLGIAQPSTGLFVQAERCRFEVNGGLGVDLGSVSAWDSGVSQSQFDSCLIANNAGGGVRLGDQDTTLRHCTIVDNTGVGLEVVAATQLEGVVVWGHASDLVGAVTGSHDDIGGGLIVGAGSLSADPRFVDRASADYRLAFDSPCVDAADFGQSSRLDLERIPRPRDGDLDLVALPDMGCFEHRPLYAPLHAALGSVVDIELYGPVGGRTTFFCSRAALLPTPVATPFGPYWLDQPHTVALLPRGVAPAPPSVIHFHVPSNALYAGSTYGFQALTSSLHAPSGMAFTQPVAMLFVP